MVGRSFMATIKPAGFSSPLICLQVKILWTCRPEIQSICGIADRSVFVILKGETRTLDLSNGSVRWKYAAKAPVENNTAVSNGIVYVGDLSGVCPRHVTLVMAANSGHLRQATKSNHRQ